MSLGFEHKEYLDEYWEGEFCAETAAALSAAIDESDWNRIQKILNEYCHEGFKLTAGCLGICSYSEEIFEPIPEHLSPLMEEWPDFLKEHAIEVANHVLKMLDEGSAGC